MRKNSYMIAVTVRPPVTIYAEVVAKNAKAALRQVKREFGAKILSDTMIDDFTQEIGHSGIELYGERLDFTCAGRASVFHSDHECQICQSVKMSKNGVVHET